MGLVASAARIIESLGSSIFNVDLGAGNTRKAQEFKTPGDDSAPLPEHDWPLAVPSTRSGSQVIAGYATAEEERLAQPGERRLYARDAEGVEVSSIWLKNDGSVTVENENTQVTVGPDGDVAMSNDNGGIELGANGDVTINGVTIKADGTIDAPGDIEAGGDVASQGTVSGFVDVTATPVGTKLSSHQHPTAATGPPSPPIPGT